MLERDVNVEADALGGCDASREDGLFCSLEAGGGETKA